MYRIIIPALASLALGFTMVQSGYAAGGHDDGHNDETETMETMQETVGETMEDMREEHREHEHGHNFEAIEALSLGDRAVLQNMMTDIGIAMPPMESSRGRDIFVNKGCIACHQVNGVGGEIGPALNADDMPAPMNAFEFAARMWGGAAAMIQMQEDLFGEQIVLSGQDLADLIAFAHDEEEQAKLSDDDIPQNLRMFIDQ